MNDDPNRSNLSLNRPSNPLLHSTASEYGSIKPQRHLNPNDQQQQQQHSCGGLYGIEHQEMVRNTFKSDNSDSPAESPTMPHSDLNGPNRLYTNMKYNSNNASGAIPVSSPNRNLSPASYAKLRCSEQLASPPDASLVLSQEENVVYSPNYYASSPATTCRDFGSARQTPEPHHSMAGEPKFATYRSMQNNQKQLFYHPDAEDFHRTTNEAHPHPHFVNAFENNFERFQRESSHRQSKPITTNDNNNRINLIYGNEPFDYFVPNDYENNEKKLQNIQHQYALHQHHLAQQQGHFRMRKDNQHTSTTTTTINNDSSNNNTNSNDRSLAYEPDSDETDSREFDRKKNAASSSASEFNCGNNDTKHSMPIKCKSEAINEFAPMQN